MATASAAGPSLASGQAAGPSSSSAGTSAGPASQQQPQAQPGERTPASAPLGAVVSDAVRRWYLEASKEAAKGDVKQQALVGQMLMEGYGCKQDQVAGKEWIDAARRRGYRMSGVYCEL